jgi:glycosyltransferase involved in cell wall biosynthesis
MIRVAHVVEDLKIGGIERIIEHIVMSLDAQRFEVTVLCLSGGGAIADKLLAHKKDVEVLNIKNFHNPFSVLKVVTWLKRKKINIVHTHGYPAGVLGRVASFFAGVPCIFHHVHSTYFNLNKRNYLIESFLCRFTKKVICCSEAVKRFVSEKEKIPKDKLVVIYNGIPEPETLEASAVKGLRKSLDIPLNSNVIGCIASLTQHKGHHYLLEALQKIDDVYLLLIGDGPLRKKLEAEIFKLGLSQRIIFLEYKMDVIPYIHLADLIVLPSSEREGLPVTIVEAMSLAKPVVATNIGGVPEVVNDGRTGILTKPKDSDALAHAIKKMVESPEVAHRMGKAGRDTYLTMFTLSHMLRRIEELYEGCK